MSGISYNKQRTRFQILIDDFSGGSAGSSGGSSSNQPNALALKLPANVMLDLENALVDVDGFVRRRGPIKASAVGANDISSGTSNVVLSAFPIVNAPNATAGPYAAMYFNGTNVLLIGQNAAAAGATLLSAASNPFPVAKVPTVDGNLVASGRLAGGSASYIQYPASVFLQSHSVTGSGASTGTVTVAVGSASVTGSGTTFTAAMEGRYFYLSSNETAAYRRPYRIKKFVSTTSMILESPYSGDGAGAARTFVVSTTASLNTGTSSHSPWGTNTTVDFGTTGVPVARVAVEHANRLFLGWIAEPPAAAGDPSISTSVVLPSRLRWSGLIGSSDSAGSVTEGPDSSNAAIQGIYGWHADGYLDLNTRYGGILAMSSVNGSLHVWQEYGMTIVYGAPTFSSDGSLNATTSFPNVQINGGFAYETTDYGVFFVDKKRGPMVYTGSGGPEPLPMTPNIRETLKSYDHVGYVNKHVLFFKSTLASTLEFWAYHAVSGRWTRFTNSSTKPITHPQRSNDHECCALQATSTGSRVISLDSLTFPDGTATDSDGSTYQFTMQSGNFGSLNELLRADRVYVTMRASGTPSTSVSVRSGLPVTPDAAHTSTSTITSTATGTSGADVETFTVAMTMDRDPTISVKITDAASTTGHLEIVQVVIEGSVEGGGFSS